MDTPNDHIDDASAARDGSTRHPEGASAPTGPAGGRGEPRTPSFLTRDVAWWEVSEPQNLNTPAFRRGIARTIRGSKKRFLSIAVIVMLGTTMLIGLNAGCEDLRDSADAYFDRQNLYDISVQSTLGLTGDDLEAIRELEGVEVAEGVYGETAYTNLGSQRERVEVTSLSKENIDQPVLVEGDLPEANDEVAVTQKYLNDAGKRVGDTVTFSARGGSDPDAVEVFLQQEYTITGVVKDPTDVLAETSTNAFRATASSDYGFYVTKGATAQDVYTAIRVRVAGAESKDCYSSAYTELVDAVAQDIEAVRDEREEAREHELTVEAAEQIDALERGAAVSFQMEEDRIARMPAGSAERAVAEAELARQRAQAAEQVADAREQIAGIEGATWYIQDRSSISSFASVDSDTSSIESIATIFPLIFFVVAILISLTTATRMVEEERTLIGLYKALGYSRRRILSKYVRYVLYACLAGGAVGCLLGFVALPEFLFTVFRAMYDLPAWSLGFDALRALLAVGLFAAGTVGATVLACRQELAETPASLMRPRAPRAGARILLERIRPFWRHLGFLNKVTARNLFRYKKRALMTVVGIAGCTALVICGFGIRDTVTSLSAKQYGSVTKADITAVSTPADFAGAREALRGRADAAGVAIEDELPVYIDSVALEHGGAAETVQLIAVDDALAGDLGSYIGTVDDAGTKLSVTDGVLITKSAAQVLGFGAGDTVRIQDSALDAADVKVAGIPLAYLGNTVLFTKSAYRDAFGKDAPDNALLAELSGSPAQQIALGKAAASDAWLSLTSTRALERDFEKNFAIVNSVVVLITAMAAALSFVVVFTLSNTNISERERELATIKVLGFRAGEVHTYVNKETLILTAIGALAGVPLGAVLAESFTYILQLPSLYFDVQVEPLTYAYAVALAFAFTIIVNLATDRSLDRIDMVGALKSAE